MATETVSADMDQRVRLASAVTSDQQGDEALLISVREGLPQIGALQRQVRALPAFRLPGLPIDDGALVHDRLAATHLVLRAIDEIPRAALAAAIADAMMLNDDVEELDDEWIGHLTRELGEIIDAGAAGAAGASFDDRSQPPPSNVVYLVARRVIEGQRPGGAV